MAIADWLNVDPTSGSGGRLVTVEAGNNVTSGIRNATLNVKTSSGLSKSVFSKAEWNYNVG